MTRGLVLAALALAGCATRASMTPAASAPPAKAAKIAPAPQPKVVRIYVPTAVKCVPDTVGPPPNYPDGDAALRGAGGAADRYQLLAAGRLLREQRLQKLEDAVKRCRSAGR